MLVEVGADKIQQGREHLESQALIGAEAVDTLNVALLYEWVPMRVLR